MAKPTTETITVPIAANVDPLVRQLVALRTLADEVSDALNRAIDSLHETDPTWPDAEHWKAPPE
jgi:hypothetical protein